MEVSFLTQQDMVLRLAISFFAGGVIGFERSSRHQTAGLKTHIIICLGATLLMLLSIWIPQTFQGMKNGDPGRIAAQVVSGIGFLGAGAMIRLGNNIKGLTTAASLWLIAALGLAIGAGMFFAAGIALILSLITLLIVDRFEQKLFPAERNKLIKLSFKSGTPDTGKVAAALKAYKIRVHSIDVEETNEKKTQIRIFAGIPVHTNISEFIKSVKENTNADSLELKENY